MASILIIDDDKIICRLVSHIVQHMGHIIDNAHSIQEGLKKIHSNNYDVVFLDVKLPDGNGLDYLAEIKESSSTTQVIIITGKGSADGAELAIRSGAWDYIQKPFSTDAINLALVQVLRYQNEKQKNKKPILFNRKGIIGDSTFINNCLQLTAQAANSNATTLITGETGTGKELFARAIHINSSRAGNNFIVVDCAALPDTLVENILFGHEKGAFTGADKRQEGLVKQAHKGTLFLDEVGELPLSAQGSFLRVLQEHRFRPVGSNMEIESDFRLIAATNRQLDKMVEKGFFREDLLYRLQSLIINIPPMRERHDDIKKLAYHYMRKLCEGYGIETKGLSHEFIQDIIAYKWPGNVREIINSMERALSVGRDEPILYPIHLPASIRVQVARASVSNNSEKKDIIKDQIIFLSLKKLLEKTEKEYFTQIAAATNGDIKKMCKISELSRSRLYDRLKKYNISR